MTRRTRGRAARVVLNATLVAVLAACGGDGDSMEDMPSMGGTPDASAGAADDPMRAHLVRMRELPADSLLAAVGQHRQMVANMLARMNREMSGMNMVGDAAWAET
ncbi:MAG: hypothetical protein AB7T31_18030, partial [Gemmatimonadales bacterium]